MSRTGGQAGRTWRLIAIAAVVGFGTWVAGQHERSELPAFAGSGTIAEPSVRAQQPPTPSPATPSADPVPRRRPAPRVGPTTAVPLTGPGGHSGPGSAGAQRQATQRRDRVKVLYLTFDDGPSREWTPKVLEVLDRYDAKATFFELGRAQRAYPALARRVRAAGHTIANHSTIHRDLTMLSDGAIRWEVRNGPDSPCFRPPYGAINHRVRSVLRSEGVHDIVLWDIDTLDWTRPGSHRIAQTVVSHARPGNIVLMHDGGANRAQTVAALDTILRELYGQGYLFRSLDC
ncbi:polysaccharide deacetylase family protein [Flindersiella endophytica]